MHSSAESGAEMTSPGTVRRFWWRTSQSSRLAITGLGVVTALVTTGAAGFFGGAVPAGHGSTGTDMALHRGDAFEVTVRTVSDVDSFEGMEPDTGLYFHAQVAGLRRITGCWQTESHAAAQNLLRGKNVWLTVKKDGSSESNEIAVDVRLPDGADYARTVVHDGVASADISTRGELASVEAAAREDRRGVWAAACAPGAVAPTSSSAPASSTPASTTTTTTTTTPVTESSAPPPSSSEPDTTTTSPPAGDEWLDARLGKLCFIEGKRRTSPSGNEMVCARNGKNQLRWRRAD